MWKYLEIMIIAVKFKDFGCVRFLMFLMVLNLSTFKISSQIPAHPRQLQAKILLRLLGGSSKMFWEKQGVNLDIVLVPTGFLFLVAYHVYLLYRIMKYPNSTVIGFENGNRIVWVQQMMKDMPNNTGLALSVISSNLSAATFLASLSITLTSLIGIIEGIGTSASSGASKGVVDEIIFGRKSAITSTIKKGSVMVCFMVAFISHVQSMRHYIHVTFLISTPNSSVPTDYIEKAVIRGSNLWSLGLRAYYFVFPLLLWIAGPITMFVCSLGMISFLYFLDSTDNPIPPFGIKSSSKPVEGHRFERLDNGRTITSNNMRE